jgi:hypothetical protein
MLEISSEILLAKLGRLHWCEFFIHGGATAYDTE